MRKIARSLLGGQQRLAMVVGRIVEPLTLVIDEEEQLVLLNGTAKGAAKIVPTEFAFGAPLKLFDHSFAFSLSLRKNSNQPPWNWLVPDLIDVLIMPPMKLPNSAEAFCVISLNS